MYYKQPPKAALFFSQVTFITLHSISQHLFMDGTEDGRRYKGTDD
jgi:hypothetical protein